MTDLFDGGGPGESEAEKDDEEEGSPQIPVPESLAGILTVRVGKHHELQIAHDSREVSLDGVPHGLGQGVERGPEPGGGDVGVGGPTGGGGDWGRGRDRWRLGIGLGVGGERGEVGLDEGGGGDGDGGAGGGGAGGLGGKDGGGARLDGGVDEVFDLVDVGLGGGVERHGVAFRVGVRHFGAGDLDLTDSEKKREHRRRRRGFGSELDQASGNNVFG